MYKTCSMLELRTKAYFEPEPMYCAWQIIQADICRFMYSFNQGVKEEETQLLHC